ncbi:MAG TPA: PhoU domain-containing protein [Pseudonocardiaceae bacterium]
MQRSARGQPCRHSSGVNYVHTIKPFIEGWWHRRFRVARTHLLVLQAPLATDLRAVAAAMHAMRDLKRMGNLAQHIAEIARLKHPMASIPAGVRPVLARRVEPSAHGAGGVLP